MKPSIEAFSVLQRFAFSLTAMSDKTFEPLQRKPVKVPETLARITVPKVLRPSPVEPIHLLQSISQRPLVPASGKRPDFVLEPLHRFPGRKHVEIAMKPSA